MKKITLLALVATFLFACSTSNDVVQNGFLQKRKYNKGWHINKTNKIKENKGVANQDEFVAKADETKQMPTESSNIVNAPSTNDKSKATVAVKKEAKTNKETTISFATSTKSNKSKVAVATSVLPRGNKETFSLAEKTFKTPQQKIEQNKTAGEESSNGHPLILLYVLAIFIPPVAVGLVTDWETTPVISNILWTLLCGIPGIIHAFIIIGRYK